MYRMPQYGKEWHWRNVKMETREGNTVLSPEARKGICCVHAVNPLFYWQHRSVVRINIPEKTSFREKTNHKPKA